MNLGPGTLFLMAPRDDLFFTHEAKFEVVFTEEDGSGCIGESVWREAWVFRSLASLKCFRVGTGPRANKVWEKAPEVQTEERERKRKRSKVAANDRRRLFISSV